MEGLRRLNLTQRTKGRPGQSQGRLSRAHTEHTDGGSDMWRLLRPQESQWGGAVRAPFCTDNEPLKVSKKSDEIRSLI